MNDKFDELAKSLAQSVTRRGALKKFGVGLGGIALASVGLAHSAPAEKDSKHGNCNHCLFPYGCTTTACVSYCQIKCQSGCC